MKLTVDGYEFDFPEATAAYKFDETDNLSPHFHGVQQMKAVDMMVEFSSCHLWVEIKTYDDLQVFDEETVCPNCGAKVNHRIWLKRNLVRKYRDTYLYRYAERKTNLPIFYICLMNFDAALLSFFKKELRKEIPVGRANDSRWKLAILEKERLIVTDESGWNRNLQRFGTCRFVG